MKRAAIYVRVSSERQAAEDRGSIPAQLKDCREFCDRRGYRIVQEYVECESYRSKGRLVQPSGMRKDRPHYVNMLDAVRQNEVDVIVAWKEDRLFRGYRAMLPLADLMEEYDSSLDIELVRETFDKRMLGIKAALGKMEVDNTRERTMMGRRAKLERGEVPGGSQVKYGYRREDRQLAVDEAEAEVVRQIFDMYINGESIGTMRKRLNASGAPTRKGGAWSKATIQKIYSGEFYATGCMSTTLQGEEFQIECPPLISPEIWRKAEEVRQRNREYGKPRFVKKDYLCAGLVYCACGWKLQARTNGQSRYHRNRGRDYALTGDYVCQRPANQPEGRPDTCAWSTGSKKVDDYVWSLVKGICTKPDLVYAAISRKLAQLDEESDGQEQEISRLEDNLRKLADQRQWVITQAREGTIEKGDLKLQLDDLKLRETEYRRQLNDLTSAALAREQVQQARDYIAQYLDNLAVGLGGLDIDVRNLSEDRVEDLAQEFAVWRYEDKFPDDVQKQLGWAILEEKRRIVRTIVKRIEIAKTPDGGRKITPHFTFDYPVESMASGHQSLDYIDEWGERDDQPLPPA